MALRARKQTEPFRARLTWRDFVPFYFFQERDGTPATWVNWPIVVAAVAGFFAGKVL